MSVGNLYGWRGRIGLIVPSLNSSLEYEFNKMAPAGVSIVAARTRLEQGINGLLQMSNELEKAVEDLATAHVDIILYGCTSGSLVKGLGYDRELTERIEKQSGVQAITTATAVIEALNELKLKKIGVVTPYEDEINIVTKKFLLDNGFDVVSFVGGKLQSEQMTSAMAYRRTKTADRPDAQGVFISCTNFQTIGILKKLEDDLRKPVISANQSSMWSVLKKLRIRDQIRGYGSLLERPR